MYGFNPYYLASFFAGAMIGVIVFSLLFRYALLGRSGSKLQHIGVVLLTGIVAIGFSGFGEGSDGFISRITNPPEVEHAAAYGLCALILALVVWWRAGGTPPAQDAPQKSGIVGRAVALVFVVPMILIGIGNFAGTAYSLAVNGPPPGPGLGVSRAELRQIMLNGDLAPFWQMVDSKAPADLDYIVERMFANEANLGSADDARQQLSREIADYRVTLAIYEPALTDEQRIEILRSTSDMLSAFEDRPELCVDMVMTGGKACPESSC